MGRRRRGIPTNIQGGAGAAFALQSHWRPGAPVAHRPKGRDGAPPLSDLCGEATFVSLPIFREVLAHHLRVGHHLRCNLTGELARQSLIESCLAGMVGRPERYSHPFLVVSRLTNSVAASNKAAQDYESYNNSLRDVERRTVYALWRDAQRGTFHPVYRDSL